MSHNPPAFTEPGSRAELAPHPQSGPPAWVAVARWVAWTALALGGLRILTFLPVSFRYVSRLFTGRSNYIIGGWLGTLLEFTVAGGAVLLLIGGWCSLKRQSNGPRWLALGALIVLGAQAGMLPLRVFYEFVRSDKGFNLLGAFVFDAFQTLRTAILPLMLWWIARKPAVAALLGGGPIASMPAHPPAFEPHLPDVASSGVPPLPVAPLAYFGVPSIYRDDESHDDAIRHIARVVYGAAILIGAVFLTRFLSVHGVDRHPYEWPWEASNPRWLDSTAEIGHDLMAPLLIFGGIGGLVGRRPTRAVLLVGLSLFVAADLTYIFYEATHWFPLYRSVGSGTLSSDLVIFLSNSFLRYLIPPLVPVFLLGLATRRAIAEDFARRCQSTESGTS